MTLVVSIAIQSTPRLSPKIVMGLFAVAFVVLLIGILLKWS